MGMSDQTSRIVDHDHFARIVDKMLAAQTDEELQRCRDMIVGTFDAFGLRPKGATDEQLVESILHKYGYYQDSRASQIADAVGSLFMAITYAGEDGHRDRHGKKKAKLARKIAANPFAAMVHGIVEEELRKFGVKGQK